VLGRRVDRVLKHMTTAMHAPFDVAEGDLRVCGVMVEINTDTRRAVRIERIELPA
jgi:calcineurin-like phosphoesterase